MWAVLPNHVKYCVSVLKPPMSKYQYTPGPRMGVSEFPNNWYQSTWFKGVFDFCSKMKVLKMVF
jgi:hypothetical protein